MQMTSFSNWLIIIIFLSYVSPLIQLAQPTRAAGQILTSFLFINIEIKMQLPFKGNNNNLV